MIWIKNTSGKKDAMLTFAFFSFAVVTFNIFLATFGTITYGDKSIALTPMDAATMTSYLAVTFSAYTARRWTDSHYKPEKKNIETVELEKVE